MPSPESRHQSRSAQAISAGPLSIRRCLGAPRWVTRRSRQATTPSAPMERPTSIARASRVLVNHIQQLQPTLVGGLVELEVECPHMVGMFGPQQRPL